MTAAALNEQRLGAVSRQRELLIRDTLSHLREQQRSAERMWTVVQAQRHAILSRDAKNVVETACQLQVEITRREVLEMERRGLLDRAGELLGTAPDAVTLAQTMALMDSDRARVARAHQRALVKLLRKVQRRHHANQTLMRQNLSFLSHLLGHTGTPVTYGSEGRLPSGFGRLRSGRRPSLDLEA